MSENQSCKVTSWQQFKNCEPANMYDYLVALQRQNASKAKETAFLNNDIAQLTKKNQWLTWRLEQNNILYNQDLQQLETENIKLNQNIEQKSVMIHTLQHRIKLLEQNIENRPKLTEIITYLFRKQNYQNQPSNYNISNIYNIYSEQQLIDVEGQFIQKMGKYNNARNLINNNQKQIIKKNNQQLQSKILRLQSSIKSMNSQFNLVTNQKQNKFIDLQTNYINVSKQIQMYSDKFDKSRQLNQKLSASYKFVESQNVKLVKQLQEFAEKVVLFSSQFKQLNATLQFEKKKLKVLEQQNQYLRKRCLTALEDIVSRSDKQLQINRSFLNSERHATQRKSRISLQSNKNHTASDTNLIKSQITKTSTSMLLLGE